MGIKETKQRLDDEEAAEALGRDRAMLFAQVEANGQLVGEMAARRTVPFGVLADLTGVSRPTLYRYAKVVAQKTVASPSASE